MRISRRCGTTGERGFTLIEVLVVLIIIGILAAIAIPTFLNQREAAQDARAKSTMRNAQTAILSYRQIEDALPDGNTEAVAKLREIEPSITWKESVGTRDYPQVGNVPYELHESNVVFGTKSDSDGCFYMRITPAGQTSYGSNTNCDDPWETSRDGRITAAGW